MKQANDNTALAFTDYSYSLKNIESNKLHLYEKH